MNLKSFFFFSTTRMWPTQKAMNLKTFAWSAHCWWVFLKKAGRNPPPFKKPASPLHSLVVTFWHVPRMELARLALMLYQYLRGATSPRMKFKVCTAVLLVSVIIVFCKQCTTLLASVSSVTLAMFCDGRYTRHTSTPVINYWIITTANKHLGKAKCGLLISPTLIL